MSMSEVLGALFTNNRLVFYRVQNNDRPIWELAAKHNQPIQKRYVKNIDSTRCV